MISDQGIDYPAETPRVPDKGTKRLIDRLREEIRARHYSGETQKAY